MTTTICGHDRETLKWALRVAEYQGEETATLMCNSAAKVAFAFPDDTRLAIERDVLWAIIDPARLALIIGETLRGFGCNAYGPGVHEAPAPVFPCVDVTPFDNGIRVQVWRSYQDMLNDESGDHDMSAARALELRLLSLPNGATAADALKALEVET